jgi:hypothetical protein
MTTLVVVAVDDFALRVEDDSPETPEWLLHTASSCRNRCERKLLESERLCGT